MTALISTRTNDPGAVGSPVGAFACVPEAATGCPIGVVAPVALSKVDALSPELLKEQVARLKRAAKRMPIILSSASGEGVEAALRALFTYVEDARKEEARQNAPVEDTGWRP